MKRKENEIMHYFRVVLSELSIKEIMTNAKLLKSAEKVNRLFVGNSF